MIVLNDKNKLYDVYCEKLLTLTENVYKKRT